MMTQTSQYIFYHVNIGRRLKKDSLFLTSAGATTAVVVAADMIDDSWKACSRSCVALHPAHTLSRRISKEAFISLNLATIRHAFPNCTLSLLSTSPGACCVYVKLNLVYNVLRRRPAMGPWAFLCYTVHGNGGLTPDTIILARG